MRLEINYQAENKQEAVEIEPSATLQKLLEHVKTITGLEPQDCRLIVRGKIINTSRPSMIIDDDLHLRDGDVINVFNKIRSRSEDATPATSRMQVPGSQLPAGIMQGSVTILSDGAGNVAINSQGAPNLPPEVIQHIFSGFPGIREMIQR